ncbi:hypothetical protein [Streptococcus saliviloxodontae]|uniref:Uncharacterized protein n=1 Tax=Streptococcus saliviloxodontae TaxID=1349416 RepID=A0ABS2PLC1_9STRE|nr:hypothetical protein [Streptococcus saliviloxodontae]MBM7636092.1 hypothetical protein [Streptococcus saliviloxodontae]
MRETELKKVLTTLRQKYVDRPAASNDSSEQSHFDSKKLAKIKQRIVGLEMERCQLALEHEDLTSIDAKIDKQKYLYRQCCQQSTSRR